MPKRQLSTEGILLSKESAGESFGRYSIFSREHGLLYCMKRISRSPHSRTQPDLLDFAELELESSSSDKLWFIKEYRVLQRASGLGRHYPSLLYASDFARILKINLIHMERFETVYELFREALRHWESGQRPEIIYFKILYLLAREEGYAVKEDWLRHIPEEEQKKARTLLTLPLKEQRTATHETELTIESLKRWLAGNTDILVD